MGFQRHANISCFVSASRKIRACSMLSGALFFRSPTKFVFFKLDVVNRKIIMCISAPDRFGIQAATELHTW